MKRNNISPRVADTARAIERAMSRAGVPASDKEQFLDWTIGSLWDTFRNERMNKRIMIENEMRQKGLRLPNGTVKKEYCAFFKLPVERISDVELEGADELGLIFAMSENGDCSVSGRPVRTGDFVLKLRYRTVPGEPMSELPIPVAFNPSPRDLWRSIPTDQGIKYYKPDSDSSFIEARYDAAGEMGKRMLAASMRGRSHAQEGNARDDDFRLYRCDDSDWYILAVADGAGSAAYSRKGSEIACDMVVEYCRQCLEDNPEFESAVREFGADSGSEEKRQVLSRKVIDIIYTAAIKAHQAIHHLADSEGLRLKDFATTLMFAVCKRYDFGWFFASFWVGDGAICILDADRQSIRLLGTPDEGEFSGQTRFLTMPEIFRDPDVAKKRMRISIVPDFTALMLMTDGVSDPMFETDRNLNDYSRWQHFYDLLQSGFREDDIPGVNLASDGEMARKQLLDWLNFWSAGNHDDRTIAILY